jgi:hypothetical protein
MARVALRLKETKVPDRIVLANRIHEFMSANAATFDSPFITMAALLAQIGLTETAVQNAIEGSKADKAIRKAEVKKLDSMLSKLAAYVQVVSDGDEVIIHSAGMSVANEGPRKYPTIETPEGLLAKISPNPGELRFRWNAIRNAGGYEVQWCPNPLNDGGWKDYSHVSASNILLQGLPSGQMVWLRVRAFSAAGESAWSAPVTSRVV